MTPAARYQAAIEVLDQWLTGMPVEQALTRWARGARYAGSKDRAAVRDHVFDVLRQKGNCQALGGETGRGLILGLLRLRGEAVEAVFSGQTHAPAMLAGPEAEVPEVAPDPKRDLPDWMHPLLRRAQADQADGILQAMQSRAPVYLRVNARKAERGVARAALAEDGVICALHPLCDGALEVQEGARRLRQARAYLDGMVEIQDLSVQAAMARVPWPESGKILDYCAGGGGKSLALADRTGAALFAHDAHPRRMADLAPRAARAGVVITEVTREGARKIAPFEAVLCDVPCSGSGTWRRDPEAKWRLSEAAFRQLQTTQDAILDQAAELVGPGGLLVYMTCSLFAEENADRVAAFLNRHPAWSCEGQAADTPLSLSDGFFAAWLRAPADKPLGNPEKTDRV